MAHIVHAVAIGQWKPRVTALFHLFITNDEEKKAQLYMNLLSGVIATLKTFLLHPSISRSG